MRVDPYEALAEYLGLQIGLRGMVRRVFETRAFRQLMDASPGWRELITLGKIWHLEQMTDTQGQAALRPDRGRRAGDRARPHLPRRAARGGIGGARGPAAPPRRLGRGDDPRSRTHGAAARGARRGTARARDRRAGRAAARRNRRRGRPDRGECRHDCALPARSRGPRRAPRAPPRRSRVARRACAAGAGSVCGAPARSPRAERALDARARRDHGARISWCCRASRAACAVQRISQRPRGAHSSPRRGRRRRESRISTPPRSCAIATSSCASGPAASARPRWQRASRSQGARLGRRVAVLTIDPARRLADALGIAELGQPADGPAPRAPHRAGRAARGTPRSADARHEAHLRRTRRAFRGLRGGAPAHPRQPHLPAVSDALAGSAEYSAMEKVFELSRDAAIST